MTQNTSPLPQEVENSNKEETKKEELLNFFDALKKVAEGKKISRQGWEDTEVYGFLKDEKLMLQKKDGINLWILSKVDLEGENDWFVLE